MPWLPVFLQRLGRRSQIPDSGRIKRQPEKRRKGQVHESGCAERKLQKKEKNCLHELLPARDFGRNRDRMWRRWANSAMNQYTGLTVLCRSTTGTLIKRRPITARPSLTTG